MMVIYVLTIMACSGLLQEDASPLWLHVTLAIATTLPGVIGIWAILRMAHKADEYTRASQIRALAEGGAMLASGLFLTGFLQIYDVIGRVEVLRLKFQVQHPAPIGHRMLRWTNDTSTSTARNVA
jgi:hypothetical protein